jgi:hypothetical protein
MLCAPAIAGAQALQAPEVGIAELSGMGELLTLAVGTGLGDSLTLAVTSGLSVTTPSSILAQPESTHTSAAALRKHASSFFMAISFIKSLRPYDALFRENYVAFFKKSYNIGVHG